MSSSGVPAIGHTGTNPGGLLHQWERGPSKNNLIFTGPVSVSVILGAHESFLRACP